MYDRQIVPAAPPLELHGGRALVADDNRLARCVLADQLRRWGLDTAAVATGEEALRRIVASVEDGRGFTVVLVDDVLPDISVPELASRAVRALGAATPPIVMVSQATTMPRSDAFVPGAIAATVAKPVHRDGLAESLHRALAWRPEITEESETKVRGLWVLLAEDDPVCRQVAEHLLGRLGCRVDVAANGVEAVVMASLHQYDAVLMDGDMPVMDGFAATEAIRAREAGRSRVPIVALTASADLDVEARCASVGMDGHLVKPVRRARLAEALRVLVPEVVKG